MKKIKRHCCLLLVAASCAGARRSAVERPESDATVAGPRGEKGQARNAAECEASLVPDASSPHPPTPTEPMLPPVPPLPDIPGLLATADGVCERDLVGQSWSEDAEHRALLGVCQSLALAYVEEARQRYVWNDAESAVVHWRRAIKVDLWFDPPVRVARLELARREQVPTRESFCHALAALSPPVWCASGLPFAAVAQANDCQLANQCAASQPTSEKLDLRRHVERDAIDQAAIEIVHDAACASDAVVESEVLARALEAKVRLGKRCLR